MTRRDCDGLIFDLDGTLIDSAPDIAAALTDYFHSRGWPAVDASIVERFIGHGPRRLVLDILAEFELPRDEETTTRALRGYIAAYEREPARHTRFYAHVRSDLRALRDRGFRLGVCTNKPHRLTTRILGLLGIAPLFDAVAGADNVPASKPDPSHLLIVAERMGLKGGEWAYIGDTTVDQATAHAAGAPFYAVPWGAGQSLDVPAAHRLSRLSDLLSLRPATAAGPP